MASDKKLSRRSCDKAEWLILNSVEHAGRRKHILGSVVPNTSQYNPFDNYSPHWADSDLDRAITVDGKQVVKKTLLRDTMQKLWNSNLDYGEDQSSGKDRSPVQDKSTGEDPAVQLNDIIAGKIAAKTNGMRAAITDLFDLFIKKHEAHDVMIESGSVKRYKIDNPGGKLGDILIPCVSWKEQLQKLFDRTTRQEQKSPFFLVTGVLICENLKVRWTRNTDSNKRATAKVDGEAILAASHQPPNPDLARHLDTEFNFDQERSTDQHVFATCKHDVIFAVRYHYLNLSFEKEPAAKEPNIFARFMGRTAKPGTIKNAMIGEVVLGMGIMSYATATTTKNKEDGKEVERGDEDDSEWFYRRPVRGLGTGLGDQSENTSSELVHQNGSVTAHINGRARS